jgi:ligand-binding SRPBCC domain-containing protein
MRKISREYTVNRTIEEVFSFFSNAENLQRLTPEELSFRILTPLPIIMSKGTLIDYKIKLSGIPFKWLTEITEWKPPFRFIDTQLKGPYKIWIHEHLFIPNGNKTTVKDIVEFVPKGWIFEPLVYRMFVRKKLEQVFDYRQSRFKDIFGE